jgi:ApaG protein
MTYRKITADIEVSAQPTYMAGHSKPEEGLFVWAYDIQIANHGRQTVQLLHRHWKITNALGQTFEVRGPGVVGEQPVIRPGESYSYSSFTVEGSGTLTVAIPAFSLDSPEELSLPH